MKEHTADDWFELGKYHSSINNNRNAIDCYIKCINKNPKHFKAWSNMAAEYFQMKLYKKSIECCKEAIRINQHDKYSWLTLAANYFQMNDDGRAYFCFDRASILGNKKAKKFLEKAQNINDKMLNAELIDVSSEIFKDKVKEMEVQAEEESITSKKILIRKIPKVEDKDFIEKLSGFLLEIGNELLVETGGITSILELYSFIKTNYPTFNATPDHLIKALKDLEKKKLIEGIKTLENSNIMIIEFVPSEITSDIKILLEFASKKDSLTYDDIVSELSWDNYRIERIMKFLESKNIAKKVESYLKGKKWYFPSLNRN